MARRNPINDITLTTSHQNANFQGNEMKLPFKGKISGDTIKLSVDFAGNGPVEYTLKRAG
jgi:hypothetical protein